MEQVSLEMRKKIQVDMLSYIDEKCRNNNIDYFVTYGTLLGAIRHNGFIPWDDDIDIALTYDNYEKLINVLSSNNYKYRLLKYGNTKDYYFTFSMLSDTSTLLDEPSLRCKELGVKIDIFCYNKLPDSKKIVHNTYKKLSFLRKYGTGLINSTSKQKRRIFISWIYNLLRIVNYYLIKPSRIMNHYNNVINKYNDITNPKYAISSMAAYSEGHEILMWNDIVETVDHKFENLIVKIPKNYDSILKTFYGDYMKLPPENERKPKHLSNYFFK